jgi:sirohydrochlorin ferrochelatase
MNFRKFLKSSTPGKFRAHRAEGEARIAPYQAAFLAAADHEKVVGERSVAFANDPSAENLAAWKMAIMERGAAHEIAQQIVPVMQAKRKEFLDSGRGLMAQLIEETEEELRTTMEKIRAEDARRSEELGETFSSSGPIGKITEKLELLRRGRGALNSDVNAASGFVRMAIEAEC